MEWEKFKLNNQQQLPYTCGLVRDHSWRHIILSPNAPLDAKMSMALCGWLNVDHRP